jgi:DNA-binding CsgD family transcriptional regulator
VSGEPGVGKSALLDSLIAAAAGFQVARAVGVEGEGDLPYAGLQQLCRPMLDKLTVLPQPQADALRVAFGLSGGEAGDPYLVGLAVLSLLSEVAFKQPLLCVVDDAHWLDPATTRALAFVARRLGADSVGLVFATRTEIETLTGLPKLQLGGLAAADARALLDAVFIGQLDEPVRERFLAETHGNPLALIELPHTLTGAGLPEDSLSHTLEKTFTRRLELLPDDTRRLLVLAAAEPLGDPLLLLRAATLLGLGPESADAAEEAGLFEIRERCLFRHPLVRSAVYGAATQRERRLAHAALADATDAAVDPDRRAWHRAQATAAPDEDVAAELERTAERAKSRGGLAAAATFLEHAALLTPAATTRAARTLAAAEVRYVAGAFDAVDQLLTSVDTTQLGALDAAEAETLRAHVALVRVGANRGTVTGLVAAAERFAELDPARAHAIQLTALRAGYFLDDPELVRSVTTAFAESPPAPTETVVELMLRGWTDLLDHGFPAGIDALRRAAFALRDLPALDESDLALINYVDASTFSLWDFEAWETLTRRTVECARDTGALLVLPQVLGHWADVTSTAGDLSAAAEALAEAESIAEATGTGPDWNRYSAWFIGWRFDRDEALGRIAQIERETTATHPGLQCVRALVHNAAGEYEQALAAAQRSCDLHPTGVLNQGLPELVEAAVHCNAHEEAGTAVSELVRRADVASTDWGLGLAARSSALVTGDESLYREAIERLGRSPARPELARAQLLYGEWLRRETRKLDAREQLRAAHELFSELGIPSFAERARRELAATGETARKRTDDTRDDLTPQETQIARLAAEGLTNPEIGAKLFLSPRTVEWHLRRVFPKLGVSSRRELRAIMR